MVNVRGKLGINVRFQMTLDFVCIAIGFRFWSGKFLRARRTRIRRIPSHARIIETGFEVKGFGADRFEDIRGRGFGWCEWTSFWLPTTVYHIRYISFFSGHTSAGLLQQYESRN